MTYTVPSDAVEAEQLRHRHLATVADPWTIRMFDQAGVGADWKCLEVGMGGGSVAAHLAERVGPRGEVLATDIDLRLKDVFLSDPPPHLQIKQHDITADSLPQKYFDLSHGRAVLEHLPEPQKGLEAMVAATRPGGWVIVEGSNWVLFDQQPMPEPFGEFMRAMRGLVESGIQDHQRNFSSGVIPAIQQAGLENIHCEGHFWCMRGGQPSLEFLILGFEWAIPALEEQNLLDGDLARRAIAQSREEDFMLISPQTVAAMGQVPA